MLNQGHGNIEKVEFDEKDPRKMLYYSIRANLRSLWGHEIRFNRDRVGVKSHRHIPGHSFAPSLCCKYIYKMKASDLFAFLPLPLVVPVFAVHLDSRLSFKP